MTRHYSDWLIAVVGNYEFVPDCHTNRNRLIACTHFDQTFSCFIDLYLGFPVYSRRIFTFSFSIRPGRVTFSGSGGIQPTTECIKQHCLLITDLNISLIPTSSCIVTRSYYFHTSRPIWNFESVPSLWILNRNKWYPIEPKFCLTRT